MKKYLLFTIIFLMFLSFAGTASAFPYTERWSGREYIGENQSEYFFFDFWTASFYWDRTTSSLDLVQDTAIWELGPLESAFIDIEISSFDNDWEAPIFSVNIWGDGQAPIASSPMWFDLDYSNSSYFWHYDLTVSEVAALEASGWGAIVVTAADSHYDYNDFYLNDVAITANTINTAAPVPEPATMLLLGTGLLGLAWQGRSRLKQKHS